VSTHCRTLENTKSVEHVANKVHHLLSTEAAAQYEDGWSVALFLADDEMVETKMEFEEQGMKDDQKYFQTPFLNTFPGLFKN
jgi:hypothetical protein